MNFLNIINKETLLIMPTLIKKKILEKINNMNKLVSVKIYSLDEVKRKVYFDYDYKAILYLMEKHGYKYEVAENYIRNMYYIEEKKYDKKKLDFLVSLKKELIDNDLLTKDELFFNYYKDKNVIVYGYDYVNIFYRDMLSNFSNVEYIEKDKINVKHAAFELDTLEDEVMFVIERIVELTKENIPLSRIHLVNIGSDYESVILKLFSMHNIPVSLTNSTNLFTTIMGKDAFNNLKESRSFSSSLEYLEQKYNLTKEENNKIHSKILSIYNKYNTLEYDFAILLSAVEHDFSNTIIENSKNKEVVNVTSFKDNFFDEEDYVFLMGFNQGIVPIIHKDEDYITDDLKDGILIESIPELNKIEKTLTENALNSIPNLIATYRLHTEDDDAFPSTIIAMFEKEKGVINKNRSYSQMYSEIKLASMIDDLIKYDKKDSLLPAYFNTFKIPYREYDNSYKKIPIDTLKEYLKDGLTLSYTAMNTFYKCQYRYYLTNILKVDKYETNFSTYLGNLFHFVLSKMYRKDFDLDKEYEYYQRTNPYEERSFTEKESFYLGKLRKELQIIVEWIKEFDKETGLTNVCTEKNIIIDKSKDIKVIFKGFVDKIMYKEYDGKTLISVIDYKTGSADIDVYDSYYGLNIQLLAYIYLIRESKLFDNPTFVGFYLQRIFNGEVNIEQKKTYLDLKKESLRLFGYTLNDELSLERFDPTYEKSKYIKGMSYGKSGFRSTTKILSEEEMDKLMDLVGKKIEDARDAILSSDFKINPKKFSTDKLDEITGCANCRFKDICFRKNEDIVKIEKLKNLDFLKEGDLNA